jgi:hypothetical protein
MKKFRSIASLFAIIMLLSITACGSFGSKSNKQASSSFQKGVPAAYEGNYGRYSSYGDQNDIFEPLKFQNKQVSWGLGDTNILDSVQYKQLNQNTYMLRGKDNHYGNKGWQYWKISFKVKDGKTYLGVNSNDSDVASSYKEVKDQKSKHVTWYKAYSDSEFNKLSKGNSSSSNSKNSSSSSSSLSASYFEGKVFQDDQSSTEYISFEAGDDADYDMVSWYNVRMSAEAAQGSYIKSPTFSVKNNQLIITGDDDDQDSNFAPEGNKMVFDIISSTQLKDTNSGHTMTLFNGSPSQLAAKIIKEKGYPNVPDPSDNDSSDDSDSDSDSYDDDDDSDYDTNDDYESDYDD